MHKIALLTGGDSSEREIALASAQTVERELQRFFDVVVFDFPNQIDAFLHARDEFAAAVPVFHGKGGEDGVIQGFLTSLQVPFIFSDVEAHAIGMDKVVTKRLVKSIGIKTPSWQVIHRGSDVQLAPPCVLKPIDDGSSLGVEILESFEGMKVNQPMLLESCIRGREFTVPVIDRVKHFALPVIEIRSKNTFFDYESKYDAALVDEICPARISESLANQLQTIALDVHELIGAKHLSRSDFMVDEMGEVWFLEINTIPGLTQNSLVPKSVRAAGLDLGELLKSWVQDVMIGS